MVIPTMIEEKLKLHKRATPILIPTFNLVLIEQTRQLAIGRILPFILETDPRVALQVVLELEKVIFPTSPKL